MGVLVRLRGKVDWSKATIARMNAQVGSAKNHSARKHKYKELLGLPNTVGNVERAFRLPERLTSSDGPPTCVSIEDAADYDVEQGTSASAGHGWEGRVMRWGVLERCAKADGAVDITKSVPHYNGSQTLRLGALPRDGTLLLLQYTRPRNIDPYAQLKGFKKFTTHTQDSAADRANRVAAATKFIVFSRARSASTTFITALNAHPNVSCGYEIFSPHNFAADGLREALGFDTHAEVMGRMPEFMGLFWSLCPSLACGFKLFPGQVRPTSALPMLFEGVPPNVRPTLRAIVLERLNITAEWLSVLKASSSGNWGTSPQRQQTISSSTKLSQRLRDSVAARMAAAARPAPSGATADGASSGVDAGTGAEVGGGRRSARAASGPSLEQFRREHKAWYHQVAKITTIAPAAIPTLKVHTESLIGGGAEFERTMREVYDFLRLPPSPGPIALPSRVTAPEKHQVGKRVSKSKSYKARREAELKRRGMLGGSGGAGSSTHQR